MQIMKCDHSFISNFSFCKRLMLLGLASPKINYPFNVKNYLVSKHAIKVIFLLDSTIESLMFLYIIISLNLYMI